MRIPVTAALALSLVLLARASQAGMADVLAVRVEREPAGTLRLEVTVRHADENWLHYADRWEVLTPAGAIVAVRPLLHPHLHEQPFTRSLGAVEVPSGIHTLIVRAHDTLHDYGGRTVTVEVPPE